MKQILVTGGAGGLGRSAAEYLAAHGCRVYTCDIGTSEPQPNIVPVFMDVRDGRSVDAAAELIAAHTDRLDAVVHLAGLYMMDSFAEISEERLSRILDVNLFGVYRVNRAFLPLLMKGGGRVVITTSELAGQKPLPFTGIYALTKTALQCYADSLRLELALLGIPVVELLPGAFRTRLTVEPSHELERLQQSTKLYGGGLKRIKPLMDGRIGKAREPEALARVIGRIVTAKKPRLRYSANASILLKLFSALPRGIQVFAMKRLLG
jgi:NAD(P)-dependent dehydrogenase (short-subunit alcohol dehydrogenase family)